MCGAVTVGSAGSLQKLYSIISQRVADQGHCKDRKWSGSERLLLLKYADNN
jgi:hypothetical protein